MAGQRDKSGLTPKMLAFCRAYIETGNQSEAYRRAYNASKMKPESVTRLASNLMADVRVRSTVTSMKAEADAVATKELGLSREWVINGLMSNAKAGAKESTQKDGTLAPINLAASNQALIALGKIDVLGMFVDRGKLELSKTFEEKTDEELDAFIAANSKF